jgi:uncharacterized LabA/DUF88 family protein
MEEVKRTEKIALFVDLENFIGFSDDLGLPFELEPVLKKLTEDVGKVLFRRSFGDLTQALYSIRRQESIRHVRQMLQRNLVQHEDVPYDNAYKNSSDMRLAVETLSIAFTHPEITVFAVISGDRDYIPLFSKLRELGKGVVGISGSEAIVSDRFRDACDAVFYVEDLYKTQTGFLNEIAAKTQAAADFTAIRENYFNLLIRAVTSLNEQGKRTVGGLVNMQLRRMQSDFDPSRAGFETFQAFIAYAREKNVVRAVQQGGDVLITLPGAGNIHTTAAPIVPSSIPSNLTAIYRGFMEAKLRQPMPNSKIRAAVYEAASKQLSYNDGWIRLSDLSHDVNEDLTAKGLNVAQPVVYKLLYTLHRAGCFAVEDAYESYDPRICGAEYPAQEWDDKFVANAIQLMRREMRNTPLIAENLSELFYESRDKADLIENKLMTEVYR